MIYNIGDIVRCVNDDIVLIIDKIYFSMADGFYNVLVLHGYHQGKKYTHSFDNNFLLGLL